MPAAGGDIYDRFFHVLPTMMATAGFDGRFLEVNASWEDQLGFPSAEMTGRSCLDFVHPEDREAVGEHQQRILDGAPQAAFEARFASRSGGHRWLYMRCAADREKRLFYMAATDITARKLTEEALRESEATLRKIIDRAPMSMSIVGFDGTIEYINQKAVETFGYPHTDIPNMDRWWVQAYPDEAYRNEVVSTWMGRVYKAIEQKSAIEGSEFRVTCKDGSVKTCFIFGVVAAGKVFVMFDDVTLRVERENTLRENENYLRLILDNAPVSMGILNLDGRIEYLNRKFTQTFGYTQADIPTFEDWERLASPGEETRREQSDRWRAKVKAAAAAGGEADAGEFLARTRDGAVKAVYIRAVIAAGRAVILFDDLTERLKAQEALRESAATQQRILELAPVAISVQEMNGDISFVNRKFTQTFGYTAEEAADRRTFSRSLFPDEKYRADVYSTWKNWAHASLETGREMPGGKFSLACRNGEIRTVYISGMTTPDRKIISLYDDITERERAARAVAENEATLRRILKQTPIAISIHALDGAIEFVNSKFTETFGYKLEDIPNLERWTRLAYPDEAYRNKALAIWAEWIEKSMRTGREMEGGEFQVVCRNGERKTVFISGIVTPDKKVVALLDDITSRVETERALRERESLYRALIETTGTGYVVIDGRGNVADANREYVRLSGHTDLKQILGRNVLEWTAPHEKEKNAAAVARCAMDGHIFNFEVDYADKDGRTTPIEINATVVSRSGVPHILTLCRDITARRRTEAELLALNQGLERRVRERTAELSAANMELTMEIAQRIDAERSREKLQQELLQSQKMEVVGQLAGGIAHDFNNILVAISGYAEFLMQTLPEGAPARSDLNEIVRETERGAMLTRQLTTISRQQPLELKVVNLNSSVEDACRMLRRLIGSNMHLETRLDPGLGSIKADQGQVAQVIMNLVINARDAMPEGGNISITTANEELSGVPAGMPLPAQPGRYVTLTVTDTGAGIPPETAARVFEPFFTTKPPGKGTGLGLSTVYAIVHQAQGGIALSTEPGRGTTFRIYFPRTSENS